MKRRLVTIHKAVRAHEAAAILALLAEAYGSDTTLDTTNDGLVVHTTHWNSRVAR